MEIRLNNNKKPEISFIFNEDEQEQVAFIIKNLLEDSGKLKPNDLTRIQVGALTQLRHNMNNWYKSGLIVDLEDLLDLALKCGYLLKNFDRME